MKRIVSLFLVLNFAFVARAQSIDPVSLVIAKVIKAIDLKVQKMQNAELELQSIQQVTEHVLSKAKLEEIADWQQRQENLYAGYFKELACVKSVVKELPQVKQIITMQAKVVTAYNRFTKDATTQKQFDELLNLSKDILRSLTQVTSNDQLVMKDADRITYLCMLRDAMSQCLDSIKALNKNLILQVAAQARAKADLQFVQQLNGRP